MVDTSKKIETIIDLIEKGKYFSVNRPRQFGKTTTLTAIANTLRNNNEYICLDTSFEGLGEDAYKTVSVFILTFINQIRKQLKFLKLNNYMEFLNQHQTLSEFDNLSEFITDFCALENKKIVLLIDEVDKSMNNQLFLDFIGMLRNKYLDKYKGTDQTFHSVILAGVHDVKTMKLKIRPDAEQKMNSPWNIATDFTIDMSFKPNEIASMLIDYAHDNIIEMDIPAIAERIYYYTSGYPFLVSKMCKIIDEQILPERNAQNWTHNDVEKAFQNLTRGTYSTTLFDDLTKNIDNNPDLEQLVFEVVYNGKQIKNIITNTTVSLGVIYGIFNRDLEFCTIHNRIFEQKIYEHILAKKLINNQIAFYNISDEGYYKHGNLNMKFIIQRFQQFMKENYSTKDISFLEREGRLLFLSFIKPIINGKGYDFKEPVVGDERRMDIVITYNQNRYVVELKRWSGEEYHQKGLQQLSDYLDIYSLKQGFLLIYDFRKEKEYCEKHIQFNDKEIFAVWI